MKIKKISHGNGFEGHCPSLTKVWEIVSNSAVVFRFWNCPRSSWKSKNVFFLLRLRKLSAFWRSSSSTKVPTKPFPVCWHLKENDRFVFQRWIFCHDCRLVGWTKWQLKKIKTRNRMQLSFHMEKKASRFGCYQQVAKLKSRVMGCSARRRKTRWNRDEEEKRREGKPQIRRSGNCGK